MQGVKRLQITIEDDLDAELGIQAAREGVSKEALIAHYIAERLRPVSAPKQDPLWEIVGMIRGGSPDDSSRIDEVVYDLGETVPRV